MHLTGLVLEGGAMRGLFTAGVLDVMMENGLAADGVIGVSAGAVFGCNYKSGQIGRTIRYNMRFSRNWRYCSMRSLLLTGDLFGAEFCYRTLPQKLDLFDYEAYAANPMPFYVVCTDVETGEAVYVRCDRSEGEWMDNFRASASMPVASRVVEAGGRKLLDGGIVDSIPIRWFEANGYERNIVVLTQPEDFVKRPSGGMGLMRVLMRRYPKVVQALEKRHEVYNETTAYIRQREREGAALVICPEKALDIGRVEHDPEKMRAVYELGREAALKKLDAMRAFLHTGKEDD